MKERVEKKRRQDAQQLYLEPPVIISRPSDNREVHYKFSLETRSDAKVKLDFREDKINMRFYTTESGETAWAPIAVIMTTIVVVMAMVYFFWHVPSQVPVGGVTHEVIVNNPAPSTPTTPSTVIIQGAPGPNGAKGESGNKGPTGATGTPGINGADGARGKPGADAPPSAPTESSDGKTAEPDKTPEKTSGGP